MGCGPSLELNQGAFDAKAEAQLVRQALKGVGTDKDFLAQVLTRRTWEQRVEIATAYKGLFQGRSMQGDVARRLRGVSGNRFRTLVSGLIMEPDVFDAHSLLQAVKGLGTDEGAIVEILATRSSHEIAALKEAYYTVGKPSSKTPSLLADLKSDTSGDFKTLIVTLLDAKRDPEDSVYPAGQAETDALALHNASEKRMFGTDRKPFIEIFTKRSYAHMVKVWPALDKLGKYTTIALVEHHLSNTVAFDDFKRGMIALVKASRNPIEYFSERLHEALSRRFLTDWRTVVRIFVYTEDMLNTVEDTYNKRQGGKTLRAMISGNTGGHFRHALLSMLDNANLRAGALVHTG